MSYNHIMYRSGLLLVALLGFSVAVASRLWRTPLAWWNWVALLLLLTGFGALAVAWRRRARNTPPKWYSLRPGILCAGSLLLLSSWFVARVPAPMGTGPAGPEVAAVALARTWSERPVVLLSLGDSVSTGYGAPRGHGYFELIRENADETYPEMAGIE